MLKNYIIIVLLFIIGILGFIVWLCMTPLRPYEGENALDNFPNITLSNNDTIIEVVYIHFACYCPRWMDYEYYAAGGDDGECHQKQACFNIIASKEADLMADSVYSLTHPSVKLHGRFHEYGDNPFFQYDSYELVKMSNSQPNINYPED